MAKAKIFDPDNADELIRGWALHATKARRKHEEAARRLDQRRYWIGVPAIIISSFVGGSIIASLETEFGTGVTIAVGLLSVAASVLASLQTFLGYAERAEKHRAAGVEYKAAIRAIEEEMTGSLPKGALSAQDPGLRSWFNAMRDRLDGLERKAPIVPDQIHESVENDEFADFEFVGSAKELRRALEKKNPRSET